MGQKIRCSIIPVTRRPKMTDHEPQLPSRIERLEESTMFAQRTIEQLDEEVQRVAGMLDRIDRRLSQIETRLELWMAQDPDKQDDSQ